MNPNKRLQVFVSSTYQDLKAERQAAVEAILTAGHIPAGMELFAAGDQSQMTVIKRWIDESDVFLLILGGRYGSIEPLTQKSYIHLEYEYAVEQGKPVFAVVIDSHHLEKKIRKSGSKVLETANQAKLTEFREQVLTRLVKFWGDPRDIKLAIHEAMAEFIRRDDLVGWVPRPQSINTGAVAEELARLAKENAGLREQLRTASYSTQTYNGLRYEDMFSLLNGEKFEVERSSSGDDLSFVGRILQIAMKAGAQPSLLHALWVLRDDILPRAYSNWETPNIKQALSRLEYYGIVTDVGDEDDEFNDHFYYETTPDGQRFILRLIVEGMNISRHRAAPPVEVQLTSEVSDAASEVPEADA